MTRLCALLCAAGLSAAAAPSWAQEPPGGSPRLLDATTVALSAAGEVHVVPDQATVTLGVQTKAPDAAQALHDNAARMAQVMAALRGAGVPEKDIQTSDLSLAAQYVYQQSQSPKPDGYQATDTVIVTVEDLGRLGPVVDAVADAGANQIQGVSFGLRDPQAAEDQARLAAVKTLQARAALYAQATDYRLGRLINLSEGGGEVGPPVFKPMVMAAARAQTPVSPGEMTVQVSVSALYELTR